MIQNATSSIEIENYLELIFNVFNSPYLDKETLYSITTMKNEIRARHMSKECVFNERSVKEKQRDEQFDYLVIQGTSQRKEKALKKKSPFTKYFREKLDKYKKNLEDRSKINNYSNLLNEFYCPSLFKLLENKLYILPLWTGFYSYFLKNISKTSSNRILCNLNL